MTIERDLPAGPCHLRAAYNPLAITGDLPDSLLGDVIEFAYSVSTPSAPASCVIESGILPDGLSMDSAGVVSGQASLPGGFAWVIKATDALGYVTRHDDACVVQPMTVTGQLPAGVVGNLTPVSYQYTVTGGVLPRVVSIQSGALPTGLSINSDGLVSGTFTAIGSFAWVVQAEDAAGNIAVLPQTLTVVAITTLDPGSLYAAGTGGSISSDNLTITKTHDTGGFETTARAYRSSLQTSGKWYVEATVVMAASQTAGGVSFGLANSAGSLIETNLMGNSALRITADSSYYLNGTYHGSGGLSYNTAGKTVGIAVDVDSGKFWIRNESGWKGGGDPAVGTLPFGTLTSAGKLGGVLPWVSTYASDGKIRVNFGQVAFSLGAVPAGFFGGWPA